MSFRLLDKPHIFKDDRENMWVCVTMTQALSGNLWPHPHPYHWLRGATPKEAYDKWVARHRV